MRLPAELRNRIYYYAFDTVHLCFKPGVLAEDGPSSKTWSGASLIFVCRQLHRETASLELEWRHIELGLDAYPGLITEYYGPTHRYGTVRSITFQHTISKSRLHWVAVWGTSGVRSPHMLQFPSLRDIYLEGVMQEDVSLNDAIQSVMEQTTRIKFHVTEDCEVRSVRFSHLCCRALFAESPAGRSV